MVALSDRQRHARIRDVDDLVSAFAKALRPPQRMTVAEWAERRRRLTSDTSAEAGAWTNARTPYLIEIMEALSPNHPCQKVVFQKSSRVGGTEALNNMVGAYMDMVKCPIMVVQPSEADAEEWSKDHLDAMLDSTPTLRALVSKDSGQRSKGNTILHKKYKGGIVYTVGASTPKSFRRRTVRVLAFDEVDGYPGSLQGEGDPVSLGETRTETFTFNKKIFLCSTPTVKGASRIEVAFEESDKRYYQVPCPECGEFQRLVWDQVQWGKERDENDLPLAEYLCIHCGSLIPHHKKTWMVKRGKWVPTRESRVRGYHLSSLYSPWMSWGQMVAEFESKKDDPTQLQTFVNTKLAETYDLANAEKWDSDSLVKLLEPMPVLPRRVAVLTAGVDVQDHSLVVQVDAWGPNEERWSIERRDIPGDTSTPAPWAELERALLSEYPLEGGGVLRIRAAMIDTGGHRTDEAYAFCKRHLRRLWWAGKGVGGEGRTLWPRTGANRFNRAKVPLHALGVDAGKESIHARLKHSMAQQSTGHRAGAGYWHFREDGGFNASYFAELTNEVQVPVYSNSSRGEHPSARRRRWVLRNPMIRNEALDISVYSLAALHGLLAMKAVRLDSPALPLSPRDGGLPLFEAALRPAPAPTPPENLNTAQKKSNGHYAEIKKTEAPVEPAPRPTPPPTPAPVAAPSPGRGARKKRSQDW